LLQAENVLGPAGRPWTKSAVFTALHRESYAGRFTFGKLKKQRLDKDPVTGKERSRRFLAPESEWVVVERPHLAIIQPSIWDAAHARLHGARRAHLTNPNGTPQRQGNVPAGKYLLSGLLRCATCSSVLYSDTRRVTWLGDESTMIRVYLCRTEKCGKKCSAPTWVPIDFAHRDIVEGLPAAFSAERLAALESRLSGPSEMDRIGGQRDQARASLEKVERAIERLLDRLEAGTDPDVNRRLDVRQAERDRLRVELDALEAAVKAQEAQDPRAVVARVKALGDAWIDVLERDPEQARELLAALFPTGLTVIKIEDKATIDWRYEGDICIPGEALALAGKADGKSWLPGLGSNQRLPD
jgi:Recombinase/Recombinase zinc beta ribbon domain